MDKKSIIGLVLIFAIFVGYMFWVAPSKEEMAERQRVYDSTVQANLEAQRIEDSIAAAKALQDSLAAAGDTTLVQGAVRKVGDMGAFNAATQGEVRSFTMSNHLMTVEFNTLGARVDRVVLTDYLTYDSNELVLITPSEDNMNLVFSTEDNRVINTKDLVFVPYLGDTDRPVYNSLIDNELALDLEEVLRVRFRAEIDDSVNHGYLEFAYTMHGDSYEVDFDINFVGLKEVVRNTPYMDFQWQNRMLRQEKVNSGSRGKSNRNSDRERYYSSIYYKGPKEKNPNNVGMGTDKQKQVKTGLDWVAFKDQYFAAILNAEGGVPFENADLAVMTDKRDSAANYLTDMGAIIGLPYDQASGQMHMSWYYGPTKLRDLRKMHRGYDRMLPLGWTIISKSISRYLIIPVFNVLERFNWNYGIIIIVFTLLIRLVLLPLVFKSYQGGAIMRILKPEMDALNKKYPAQEQAMQKQQAMMALQKKAGYSPMAGCLPVLIQMPFLTAMFMFFPIAIELRQKSFLWCPDLSNYDSILDFGFNVPLYGDHISLFCLLMFGMQFFYTWYTMKQQAGTQSMPGMKFMMYFMPFMMLFIFNSQSAGLNLYYLVSLTFTMCTMMLIRRFTSEKKVRARMAAYDQKHAKDSGKKKKSSFQQRLEELQKQAEQMQKQQQKR
ncbi:MAG: membrane protein insertase YidC [Bacteroidales bacterium]|nr:membrane protein insertase YidC [Bacteroidales bacterium]